MVAPVMPIKFEKLRARAEFWCAQRDEMPRQRRA
jgi:hypothetical protein